MALSAGVANPGTISGVGVANPGTISGVGSGAGTLGTNTYNPQGGSYDFQQAGGNVLGANTYGTGGGGGYTAPVDPYNTSQHAFLNSLGSALGNVTQGGADAFNGAANNLQGSANNILSGFRNNQQNIDQNRQTNELSRMNATQDLLGYIRSGLKQGGSQLANMNATDSSATDALARAYSQEGAQKQRGINNQAAVAEHGLDVQQGQLNQGLQDQLQQFHLTRDNLVNQVGSDVRNKLAYLQQQAIGLSLPDQVNVEQQKQAIIDAGMGQLQNIDNWLQGQVQTIQPQDATQVIQGAHQLQQAGNTIANSFNPSAIQQQLVQGPQVDQLPLFSARKVQ